MDAAIEKFLSERKAGKLKNKIKANMSEHEKSVVRQKADAEFLPENWLPKAAARAKQLFLVSHPAKFSHPSAKSTSVVFNGTYDANGFLYSGNANAELDVFGNAAAMDVFKFLLLKLSDNITILKHLELCSDKIKKDLNVGSIPFDELRNGFLEIKKCSEVVSTDTKIKQVYFPVDGVYHLLSILSPSGLIYELKNKIQLLHFSDETKEAREDKKKYLHNENGFNELYNLSMIGYGGTKPQNISVLNSAYGGKSYLLLSVPPVIKQKYIKLPLHNFFISYLWRENFKVEFKALHKIFSTDHNNKSIRDDRDAWIQAIIDKVIHKMRTIRLIESGWSAKENCKLPLHQKICLDNVYQSEREKETDWFNKFAGDFARWFIHTYKAILGKKAKGLGDKEWLHIKTSFLDHIEKSKEGLL